MTNVYRRFAVCWCPAANTPLAAFGRAWTAWCPESGETRFCAADPFDQIEMRHPPGVQVGKSQEGQQAAHGPGMGLGLAAVLSGPFTLARGRSIFALEGMLDWLAGAETAFDLPALSVHIDKGGVDLSLTRPSPVAQRLAMRIAQATRLIQTIPTPLHLDFLDHRLPAPATLGRTATEAQFRIVLPGPENRPCRCDDSSELLAKLLCILPQRQRVADLALMGDPGFGRPWRLIERFPLSNRLADRAPEGLRTHGHGPLPPVSHLLDGGWDVVIA